MQAGFLSAPDEFVELEKTTAARDVAMASSMALTVLAIPVVVGIIALVQEVGISFLMTRRITQPLNRVITGFTEASNRTALVSFQAAVSNRPTADGTSEQTAFQEETFSSLEEISCMEVRNRNNVAKAKELVNEAGDIVAQVDEYTNQMARAVAHVIRPSEESRKTSRASLKSHSKRAYRL